MTDDFAGYVYFVQAGEGGPIKIGYSQADWRHRIRTLQTAIPVNLVPILVVVACPHTERELHKEFAPYCIRGEWFAWCAGSKLLVEGYLEHSQHQMEYVDYIATPPPLLFPPTSGRGRPRKWASEAERQKAYRARKAG